MQQFCNHHVFCKTEMLNCRHEKLFPDDFSYPGSPGHQTEVLEAAIQLGVYLVLVRGEIMRGKIRNSFANPTAFQAN